jgi:integrase/recombinase XerD
MTTRGVEKQIGHYVAALDLDPNVTVHSLRVTALSASNFTPRRGGFSAEIEPRTWVKFHALTTARERGSDIIALQDFAGHADPRTTLTYIRSRDRLSKSPAYVLKY